MGLFNELKKALTTTGDGAALVPYDLERALHEELLKLQPLTEILSVIPAEGKTHEYNVRSSHPQAWFEGETAVPNYKNSVYARKTVQLKIQRIWGSVTGFAQAVTEPFLNALEKELIGSVEGMSNVIEYGIMWGAADDITYTGDAYQYSGIIPRLFKYAPQNVIDGGGNVIDLTELDALLGKVTKFRQTRVDTNLLAMGLEMKLKVDGLQSKVSLPLTTVELADGKLVMSAYGRAPIYETDYLVPGTTSPAVAGSIAAGGALPLGDYKYRLSSVTMTGECIGGTASGTITSATTNNTANLTFTADANAYLYMLWRQFGGAGAYNLVDIFPAKTYDANGNVSGTVTTYADAGARAVNTYVKPLESGEENVLILNTNQERGAAFVGLVDEMGQRTEGLVSYVELARTKDSYDYFLKSYQALRLVNPNLAAILRHAKKA